MSLKGPIFPKIKAALKSLIKDKTKEHTVKSHLLVQQLTGIRFKIFFQKRCTKSMFRKKSARTGI